MTPNDKESAELRMDAYYYEFDKTGVYEIDKILSAVACAGKAFHYTDGWTDEFEWTGHDGKTPVEWIQNAANAAAALLKRLPAKSAQGEDGVEIARSTSATQRTIVDIDYKSLWEACHHKHEAERNRRMELETQLERIIGYFEEEYKIVERIWALFGSPTYEELEGKSIYELIKDLQAEVAKLKREGYAPDGYVLAPLEPTEKMKLEGRDYLPATPGGVSPKTAGNVYEAMLAAAPTPEGK